MKYARSPQPELFKQARKQLQCSQASLARRLGVHKSTICRIEQGKICPSASLLIELHRLTNTAPELLVQQALHCSSPRSRPNRPAATLAVLDKQGLLALRMRQEAKVQELKQERSLRQNELDEALEHSSIDALIIEQLEAKASHLQKIVLFFEQRQASSELLAAVRSEWERAKKKLKEKQALACTLLAWEEVQAREEIAWLEQERVSREAKLAELNGLINSIESTEQENRQQESDQAMAASEALRAQRKRNVARMDRTQRCVQRNEATRNPHQKRKGSETRPISNQPKR